MPPAKILPKGALKNKENMNPNVKFQKPSEKEKLAQQKQSEID